MSQSQAPWWKRIHWVNFSFMTLTPLAAAIFVPYHVIQHGFSWGLIALFLITYTISNMSITCGYHRYFSHKSYNLHPVIEWLYILVGSGAFQGSILQWCADHRRHHKDVDTDNDPYSINKGFWYAHIGWMLVKEEDPPGYFQKLTPDLMKNKWIVLQHRYYPWIATAVGFGVPGLIGWAMGHGWGGVIFGGALRIVCSQHSTFFINSLCHTLGRQPYSDRHTARDSFIMAVLTFGEGYHNYHHEFQADFRNGIRWYHWDPTKWWIQSLAWLGLASRLKTVSPQQILKVRMQMEEKRVLARGACAERVMQLKMKIEEAQAKMKHLREEYARVRANLRQSSHERYVEMKAELKMAQLEFKAAYAQWTIYVRSYQAVARA